MAEPPPNVIIRCRSAAGSLLYLAGKLAEANEHGSEAELRTAVRQVEFTLRVLAIEADG